MGPKTLFKLLRPLYYSIDSASGTRVNAEPSKTTVDDANPGLTPDYWNYGKFLIMGYAGFISSTVGLQGLIE